MTWETYYTCGRHVLTSVIRIGIVPKVLRIPRDAAPNFMSHPNILVHRPKHICSPLLNFSIYAQFTHALHAVIPSRSTIARSHVLFACIVFAHHSHYPHIYSQIRIPTTFITYLNQCVHHLDNLNIAHCITSSRAACISGITIGFRTPLSVVFYFSNMFIVVSLFSK